MGADYGEDKLADLLAACDDALAKGDSKSSFDALRSTDGNEQRKLRKKLACVQMLRRLWPRDSDGVSSRAAKSLPQKLGRFEVRRELGRGGFGVVYQAFDPKLGRDIALKLPREDLVLTPALRERFQTEARAAAGLDHPNIVSVYEAGELGTTCYIASAYCPGLSLDGWLHQRKEPVPAALAATILAALADAVHHAHTRGVLHRDLKPANILLTGTSGIDDQSLSVDDRTARLSTLNYDPHSASLPLVPKITDFGLAKLDPDFAPTPVNGAGPIVRPTRTGAIVGTPTYMAPEQAAGDRKALGPAVDIYALGVVLYEVLVGRPPFVAETVLDTLQLVRSAEPVPPTKLRAKLPRDLETICLKCLRKDPKERYSTAAALADDLRRFVAHEPILARPISKGERAWRLCRKNPWITGLAASLVLVVCAGLLGVLLQWQRARDEADQARFERDDARTARASAVESQKRADGEAERTRIERDDARSARVAALASKERAEIESKRARQAVEKMTTAGRELYKQKGHEKAGRKILEEAVLFHQALVAENSNDPAVILDAALAWNTVANIRLELGERTAAVAGGKKAMALYQRLIELQPDVLAHKVAWASRSRTLGHYLRWNNQPELARQAYEDAESAVRKLLADDPNNSSHLALLSNTLLNNALTFPEADAMRAEQLHKALEIQKSAVRLAPKNPTVLLEAALIKEMLGLCLWARDRSPEAIVLFEESLSTFDRIGKGPTAAEDGRWYYARNRHYYGVLLSQSNRSPAAAEQSQLSLAIYKKLHGDYPQNPRYIEALITAWAFESSIRRTAGDRPDALKAYDEANLVARHLFAEFPERVDANRAEVVSFLADYMGLLFLMGRPVEAVEILRQMTEWDPKRAKP